MCRQKLIQLPICLSILFIPFLSQRNGSNDEENNQSARGI